MLNKMDYKYFQKARQAATISDYHQIHVGCVAVYQGVVIGIGCNCNKTHPIQKYYNKYREESDEYLPKLHAEIHCINQSTGFAKTSLLALHDLAHRAWLQLRIWESEIFITQPMRDMYMNV